MQYKDIPFPKEYGSWGILVTSCLIGLFVSAGTGWQEMVALPGIAMLFMTKAPLGTWMRRRDRRSLLFIAVYGTAGAAFLIPALLRIDVHSVLLLSAVPLLSASLYAASAYLHKERAVIVEMFAMAALTMPAMFLILAAPDRFSFPIAAVWLSAFLYFSASIFRVKMLLFKKRVYRFLNALYLCAAFLCMAFAVNRSFLPPAAAVSFLPLAENLADTFRQMRKRNLKVVGISELAKGIVFAMLLVLAARHVI